MSDLKNWADDASLNVASCPDGWPEGMPPSDVNNSAREMMAALRRSYVRQPWFAPGGSIVRASTTTITIADDAKVTNYSSYYTVGARVRIETTDNYVTGFVATSLYEAPTSTITFELDAGADLPATITDVYVGLSPEDIQGVAGPNLLGCIIGFTEEGTKIGAGLLLANGQKFNPNIYPDLAQLYYVSENTYRYGQELVGDVYWPKLPDVRGYFQRYADDNEAGAGVDPSSPRTVGTVQSDTFASHTHNVLKNAAITYTTFNSERPYIARQSAGGLGNGDYVLCSSTDEPDIGKSSAVGSDETRPKNIAMVGVVVAYGGVISSGLADVTELETFCTAERVRAGEYADAAAISAQGSSDSATAASGSATLAQQWATKMDGQVASTDYSAKYYAGQSSTSASSASSSADLAHAWATSSTVVESGQYGASYYALRAANYASGAETARDTARNWATKTDGPVADSDYSAKYNANLAAASATAAQDWASKMDGPVSGTSYSSEYYATQSAASATQAAEIVASLGTVLKYKGSVATYADLPTATAETGDVYNVTADGKNYAFTAEGTWDDFGGAITVALSACTDVTITTPTTGQVLIYNSSTQKWENGTLDALPDQTGQSGKFLTTNGTTASWGNALANTATGTSSLTVLGTVATGSNSVNVGVRSTASSDRAIAIGYDARATGYESVAIGANYAGNTTSAYNQAVAIGTWATASGASSVALGYYTIASGSSSTALGAYARASGDGAIQIGIGTNSTAGTLSVGFSPSHNYQLLNSSGQVPTGRYIAMTGADGANAGTIGAVPAPAATDNTKFLRGDGTWADAGGSASYDALTETITL